MRVVIFFIALFSFAVHAADIKNIRIWPEPTKVRVVLDLSSGTQFKQFLLENPDRLVIDIPNGKFVANTSALNWPMPITSMRYAQYDKNTLRLVFDLKNKIKPQVFTLAASGPYGDRLVIDLINTTTASPSASPTPVVQKSEPRIPEKAANKAFVVAIDAGHGGEDPGAIGPSGTHEKNIVLAISKKLAELIRKEPGMKAVLVRDADYFIPLRQRSQIARKHQADLFVSIHADAFHDSRANGASVYTLSQSGASSEAARWLAEQENQSDLI
ncbi:MAG: N-acetylmuramoyl-L-alanine amidase, partial [Gammaproteobacteria bacterium]